jgi:glycosyltransferase involved in cell wall biosynthesis
VIRVVHVVVAGEIGGAERMLIELAKGGGEGEATGGGRAEPTGGGRAEPTGGGEAGATHAVALFTPSQALRRLLLDAGLRVHDRGPAREGPLPFLWRSLAPPDVAWLARVLRDERASVVHLHTFASQVLGTRAALRAGVPVVRTEHSTRVYDDASCWPFSRWSLARVDAAVAVSQHVRAVALARAPWAAGCMTVVPNGVDTARFAPGPAGPKGDGFVFTLVGRLEPRKGVDRAIQAMTGVPGATLDVVGDGEARAALEAQARALGVADRVRFHGYVEDVRPLLAGSRAALCTSRAEGLGVALLEAMAVGLPVVGFAVGGVPEIVVDGETGLLCPAEDVGALMAAMRSATGQPAHMESMGGAARKRVVERFSVESMRAGYAAVYGKIAHFA